MNPSAIKMFSRTAKARAEVLDILTRFPSCKGDYRQLVYRVWTEYHDIHISFEDFQKLLAAYSPETICRRYREIVAEEMQRLEANPSYEPISIPSDKTLDKRAALKDVYIAYYGNGQTHLNGGENE